MPLNATFEFENINTKNKYIDIYSVGYKIINYQFKENKLICTYEYEYEH